MHCMRRSYNFMPKEIALVLKLAAKYKLVIECRRTDRATSKQKTEIWNKIENEFNAASGEIFRSAAVLKKKYENIKKTSKRKFSEEKQATREGPRPVDETIHEQLPQEKEDIWNKIEKEFNAVSGETFRSAAVLKKKYEDIKKTAKRKFVEEKQAAREGPRPIDGTIHELLGEQAQGLPSAYDGDVIDGAADGIKEECQEMLMSEEEEEQPRASTPKEKVLTKIIYAEEQEGSKSSNQFVFKRSPAAKLKRKTLTSDKWQELAEVKMTLVQEMRSYEKEKHELQMQFLREEHEIKMSILKEELKAAISKNN